MLHDEDMCFLRSDPFCHRSETVLVHFFSMVGLSGLLSFLVLSFRSLAFSLDESGLFAVVAHTFVTRLAATR